VNEKLTKHSYDTQNSLKEMAQQLNMQTKQLEKTLEVLPRHRDELVEISKNNNDLVTMIEKNFTIIDCKLKSLDSRIKITNDDINI